MDDIIDALDANPSEEVVREYIASIWEEKILKLQPELSTYVPCKDTYSYVRKAYYEPNAPYNNKDESVEYLTVNVMKEISDRHKGYGRD